MMSGSPVIPAGQGSSAALSLMTSPTGLIVMASVAGAVVLITGATCAYKAWEHYQDKKHRKLIEAINLIHNRYLDRIFIPDNHEIISLPAPFKLEDGKPASTVDYMHYTDDQLMDIASTMPRGADIELSPYREYISNAITLLKKYYFSRSEKDRHDTTSAVITYLLHLLESKCLNFAGYDFDIAIIDALSRFINDYASMQNKESSKHFTYLNPVYAELQFAKQQLQHHKDKLSLESMFIELRDTCLNKSKALIKEFTKLTVEEKYWPEINFSTMKQLRTGLLSKEYTSFEILGLVLTKDPKVLVRDSSFKPWVMELADYYLEAIDPDTKLKTTDIIPPFELLKVPDISRLLELRSFSISRKLTKEEKAEYKAIRKQFSELRSQYKTCRNFITTKLNPETIDNRPEYESVSSEQDIYDRTVMLKKFALLIHEVISLLYLATHIIKSLKQLGEIYVKNPQHFRHVFNVLSVICKDVEEGVQANALDFQQIQLDNANAMQLAPREALARNITNILDSTRVTVKRIYERILSYRNRVPTADDPTVASVNHEMFEVASLLSNLYHISCADSLSGQCSSNAGDVNDELENPEDQVKSPLHPEREMKSPPLPEREVQSPPLPLSENRPESSSAPLSIPAASTPSTSRPGITLTSAPSQSAQPPAPSRAPSQVPVASAPSSSRPAITLTPAPASSIEASHAKLNEQLDKLIAQQSTASVRAQAAGSSKPDVLAAPIPVTPIPVPQPSAPSVTKVGVFANESQSKASVAAGTPKRSSASISNATIQIPKPAAN